MPGGLIALPWFHGYSKFETTAPPSILVALPGASSFALLEGRCSICELGAAPMAAGFAPELAAASRFALGCFFGAGGGEEFFFFLFEPVPEVFPCLGGGAGGANGCSSGGEGLQAKPCVRHPPKQGSPILEKRNFINQEL
jgi:hypothetical protein